MPRRHAAGAGDSSHPQTALIACPPQRGVEASGAALAQHKRLLLTVGDASGSVRWWWPVGTVTS